jgi:protein-tyrosine phosphatase
VGFDRTEQARRAFLSRPDAAGRRALRRDGGQPNLDIASPSSPVGTVSDSVIDLHCHVLPGLDDGPATIPEALALAGAAAASGTTTLVATPHIDWRWGVSPAEIATRAATFVEILGREGVELDLRTGGEIALSRLPDLTSEELAALRLGGGPYLLIESPLFLTSGNFDLPLLRMCADGESIVLAHPERCPLFQQEPELLVRLVREGLLCSITAGSMRGDFGRRVRRFTIDLLREQLVHSVCSDAHDHVRRPPTIADAFTHLARELPDIADQAEWLTRLAPAAILAGEPLPPKSP